MSFPTSQPIRPPDPNSLPPARRRRQQRSLIPGGLDEQIALLEELSRRVFPSYDFFIFSLFAGLIAAGAILADAPGFSVLAALAAPFMGPTIGMALAIMLGQARYFAQAFGGLVLGSLAAFLAAAAGGLAARLLGLTGHPITAMHTHFTLPDVLVLALGSVLTTVLLVRSPRQKPLIPSVTLAYELYLPISAAGYGLAAGIPGLFPDGLLVFLVYLAGAALFSTLTLLALGLRPANILGYTLGSSLVLVGAAAVLILGGLGTALTTRAALPTPPPTASFTPSISPTISSTPLPPTITPTPTRTLVPSATPTLTVSPRPTPVYARIFAQGSDGAVIRESPEPTARVVKSLLNGMLIEVLPEVVQTGSTTWAHVRTVEGQDGWIVRNLLITATPVPGW